MDTGKKTFADMNMNLKGADPCSVNWKKVKNIFNPYIGSKYAY